MDLQAFVELLLKSAESAESAQTLRELALILARQSEALAAVLEHLSAILTGLMALAALDLFMFLALFIYVALIHSKLKKIMARLDQLSPAAH